MQNDVISSGKGNAFSPFSVEVIARSLGLLDTMFGMQVVLVANPFQIAFQFGQVAIERVPCISFRPGLRGAEALERLLGVCENLARHNKVTNSWTINSNRSPEAPHDPLPTGFI
jgi:hypothetical protein